MTTKLGDGGRQITKPITVFSNDPKNSKLVLRITGHVSPFVRVEPERVSLNGQAGEEISRTVRIIPEAEGPFEVVRAHALRGTEIEYRLEKSETGGKKTYVLHIRNTKQTAGRYYDKIVLTVESEVVKSIPIIVIGNIQPGAEISGKEVSSKSDAL